MIRCASVLALLLLAGIAPAQPPKDMLAGRVPAAACDCPVTGVCRCVTCPCGLPGYTAIYARAQRESIRLVIFAGLPRRDVEGCATVGYEKWCSATTCYPHNVIVGNARPDRFEFWVLPATATDQQIRDAGKPQAVAVQAPYADPPGWHRHMDSAGNVWTHTAESYGQPGPHRSPWTGELVWATYHGPKAPTPLESPVKMAARPAVPFAMSMSFGRACPT